MIRIDLFNELVDSLLVSLLQRRCQCNDLVTSFYLISESDLPHVHLQLVSLLQWHDQNQSLQWASWSLHSELTTIDISMIWKINRKIDRKMSVKLYVSAMNYITSHRNMIFKEKRIMLQSVSTLLESCLEQVIEIQVNEK